jgi:hypothetical protein
MKWRGNESGAPVIHRTLRSVAAAALLLSSLPPGGAAAAAAGPGSSPPSLTCTSAEDPVSVKLDLTGNVAGVSAHLSRPTKRNGAFVVRVSLVAKSGAVGLYTYRPPPPPGGWKQPMFGYLPRLIRTRAQGELQGTDRGGGRSTIAMADDLDIDLARQGADVVMRLAWAAKGGRCRGRAGWRRRPNASTHSRSRASTAASRLRTSRFGPRNKVRRSPGGHSWGIRRPPPAHSKPLRRSPRRRALAPS